jgi:hypothetical protein
MEHKNPMPTPRYTFGVATVTEKIYAIGGMSQNGTVGTNEEYDPETDIWTTKSSMPIRGITLPLPFTKTGYTHLGANQSVS